MQNLTSKNFEQWLNMWIKSTKIMLKSLKKPSKLHIQRPQNRGLEGSGQLLGTSWLQEASQMLPGHLLDASGEALGADSS